MEFRINHIIENQPCFIEYIPMNRNESEYAFFIRYGDKTYNTLFDDVMYIFNKVERTVSKSFLEAVRGNFYRMTPQSGIRLQMVPTGHDRLQLFGGYDWYVRVPHDPSHLITVEKTVIKEVKTVQEVEVPVINGLDGLDECFICMSNKAYISFGCCKMKQCLKCALQITKTKGTCAQCRKSVNADNMISVIFE